MIALVPSVANSRFATDCPGTGIFWGPRRPEPKITSHRQKPHDVRCRQGGCAQHEAGACVKDDLCQDFALVSRSAAERRCSGRLRRPGCFRTVKGEPSAPAGTIRQQQTAAERQPHFYPPVRLAPVSPQAGVPASMRLSSALRCWPLPLPLRQLTLPKLSLPRLTPPPMPLLLRLPPSSPPVPSQRVRLHSIGGWPVVHLTRCAADSQTIHLTSLKYSRRPIR